MGSTKVNFDKEVPNSLDHKENLQIKMFDVPTILITSPLFEHDDRFLPRITVTRAESDIDQNEVEENILSMEILDEVEMNLIGSTIGESRSIFPDSLFDAARSGNANDRNNVEDFINSRLDYINGRHESEDEHLCRCERMTRTLEDSLECPVCRDKISGHVYQCHAGHVMCSPCRTRLLTCPVCRSLLTLPAIRNRALEKLAFLLG